MDVTSQTAPAPARRPSFLRMTLLLLVAVTAMGNGLYFSPYFDKLLILVPRLTPAFFIRGQAATFYLTGFALWMLTLAIAGIPAAAWDRLRGHQQGSAVSLLIWLIAAAVLTYDSWLVLYELFFDN